MQRPTTNYGNSWGVAPYSHLYGTTPYVGPFGGFGNPGDPGEPPVTPPENPATQANAISATMLQVVAAAFVGAVLVSAASPAGKGMERAAYGAALAGGAVAIINGFTLGFKDGQAGLGVGVGLVGALVTWIGYANANKPPPAAPAPRGY
jgi:hypothetical protein